MIMRRLLDSVRRQNWFAVCVDTAVVVVGIFLGIQANNWKDAQSDTERGLSYLNRIREDLGSEIREANSAIDFYGQVDTFAKGALQHAETGPLVGDSAWNTLVSFYQAGHTFRHTVFDASFQEMVSAGDLRLIREQGLRTRLVNYYTLRRERADRVFSQLPAYREHIRGWVPSTVQDHFWTHCYNIKSDEHRFIDCKPGLSEALSQEWLKQAVQDPVLLRSLRYWKTQMRLQQTLLDQQRIQAGELAAQIQAEMARIKGK